MPSPPLRGHDDRDGASPPRRCIRRPRSAAPVAGYGLAWIGEHEVEKNRPASWLGPKQVVWSLRGDLRMWRMMLAGKMDAEVERLRDGVDQWADQPLHAVPARA